MGAGRSAGRFKEGAGDLGVRAQEGNQRVSRAGIAAGRCAAGRGGVDEPGSWARLLVRGGAQVSLRLKRAGGVRVERAVELACGP